MTAHTTAARGRAASIRKDSPMGADAAHPELVHALRREADAVRELREALLRQRAGVAADSAPDVQASCDDIARVLVALETARRHRGTLLAALAPGAPATLEGVANALGGALPAGVDEARRALRGEAESAAREAAVNRTVLQRTIEAGEAFLQALFAHAGDPDPVYRAGERRDDDGAGFLLDRKV
jgi:hypothetical protein